MRELTRSNDPVFLSFLTSELAAAGIEAVSLDGFAASVLEPMNVTAQQRIMVTEDEYWEAWAVLAEAEDRVREDFLLGGKVRFLQPVEGFRAAIDPVLLAASVPAVNGDRVLDVGCGTGAAALCLLARCPWAWVEGVDVQPDLIALAARSAERSGSIERIGFTVADIAGEAVLEGRTFDHVMSNPPFLELGRGRIPVEKAVALAKVESTASLPVWLDFMVARLKDGGTLSVVHRADRCDEILAHLGQAGIGALKRLELVPMADGRPVKRCIIQGRKGAAACDPDVSTLIVHEADGSYTPAASAVLREAGALCLERPPSNP